MLFLASTSCQRASFLAFILALNCLQAESVEVKDKMLQSYVAYRQVYSTETDKHLSLGMTTGAADDCPAVANSQTTENALLRSSSTTAPTADPSSGDQSVSDVLKAEQKREKELLELSKTKKGVKVGNAPCLTWLPPDGNTRAVILCVHGLGLHNGTYADFGQVMSSKGFAVYAIDVRGFGSFMEAKGRENVDFDGCLNDVQATLKVLHRAHKGLPVYLLGESMGGAIALRATAIYPELVDGLISSVPANDRFRQNHTRLSVAIHLLENPDKPFDVGKDIVSQATNKQDLRDQWCKDPLNKLNLSPKELLQFQHFMNQNHKAARLIQVTPVLFVQGCNDKLVKPMGTVELFNELATKDRRLDLLPNTEHLIFEENQFTAEGINKVIDWIDAHLVPDNATGVDGKSRTASGAESSVGSVNKVPTSPTNRSDGTAGIQSF
ncbi:MAG: alpha/beta fold hydrolase [Candidatus Obscuribacterales bacterium]|nr:MAG: alpha/beta fold hydrolase [Candidatus Melainabacteria bacterium]